MEAIDPKRIIGAQGASVVTPISAAAIFANPSGVVDRTAHAARLRKMAAKCRRLAANLTDETSIAELHQMAAEYEAKADRIDHTQPNPRPPIRL